MSVIDFNALYDQVTSQTGEWEAALLAAWGCLSEDQKELLETAT